MTTIWPDIQPQPTNGHPFLTAASWNEFVDSVCYLDEHTSVLEMLYSGGGIPLGGAVMWYGLASAIPTGWQICDGTNGTPDYRGRFIMGASADTDLLVRGGSETHVHAGGTVAEGGAHTHTPSSKTTGGPSATGGITGSGSWITGNNHNHNITPTIQSAGAHDHTIGTSGASDGLPPYKRLYWITRLP